VSKKDEEIERLMKESIDTYSDRSKRRKQGKEKETNNTLLGEMQEKIKAMEDEMTRILGEKGLLEVNNRA